MKSKFTFQPIKHLVSTTVKSATPVATFWIFFPRTKNRQLCCLAAMARIVLAKRRVMTTKMKNHLFSEGIFPPITINHTRCWAKRNKNPPTYGIVVSTSHWLTQLSSNLFPDSFETLSVYSKATWFSQSPMTVLSSLSILDKVQLLWL